MNFEFLKENGMKSPDLQRRNDVIAGELEEAERIYWREPRKCGIILRGIAEEICRIYNLHYEIGYPADATLEQFLCYTDEREHNAMVSRFLSCVRKEQRDRLNKIRVWGDDCILGEAAPDQGMTLDDRMEKDARHMMDTMMEVVKEMSAGICKRDDVSGVSFQEEKLPETRKDAMRAMGKEMEPMPGKKKSLIARIFGKN